MKKQTLITGLGLSAALVSYTSYAQTGTKPTASQKAIKKMDSPAAQKAKQTQKAKAAARPSQKLTQLAAGTWALDPMHSTVGFSIKHASVNDVHGAFDDIKGTIIVNAQEPSKSSVKFVAKTASVNTHVKMRDEHLRKPDFFDAEKYPEIKFTSIKVKQSTVDYRLFRVTGYFSMRGVTKVISFPFRVTGPVEDGFGYVRGGINANFTLNRQDYGLTYGGKLPDGALMLDNIVRVNLDLEAVKAGTGPKQEPK